ncbi:HpcH/HpaI aldolase [Novosphingobium nitrogenifigens DSM 19370]|uniref:HpcH/HpaI aldolase n=1 Tax=Novosphingobium nitrogenifigens DSM 19370 TaxID=983920 RepID=F1Z5V0_9SPHN|nr:CoA ester lyase [Novosphingobium nitrogenifigens]EGD60210.1 HpcH/HpaI aldolase [Novosphingobium nitrogenifigens DSM 19370]
MPIAPRSWLLVPGDDEDALGKALDSGAEAVVVDLEETIAPDRRKAARTITAGWLRRHDFASRAGGAQIWVRINDFSSDDWCDDLVAIIAGTPNGLVLPKAASSEDVRRLAAELDGFEPGHGIAHGRTRILPMIGTTPRAAATIPAYLTFEEPRLAGLSWDADTLGKTLGVTRIRDGEGRWTDALRHARTQTLLVAHALDCWAIDTAQADFADEDGLERAAGEAAADGFSGMFTVHPAQVPAINRAFARSPALAG